MNAATISGNAQVRQRRNVTGRLILALMLSVLLSGCSILDSLGPPKPKARVCTYKGGDTIVVVFKSLDSIQVAHVGFCAK